MLLKLVYNWIYIHKCVAHLRTKADCFSDLSDLHTVCYLQDSFHILITLLALCHLNNNRAALLQPEARLIACVMW